MTLMIYYSPTNTSGFSFKLTNLGLFFFSGPIPPSIPPKTNPIQIIYRKFTMDEIFIYKLKPITTKYIKNFHLQYCIFVQFYMALFLLSVYLTYVRTHIWHVSLHLSRPCQDWDWTWNRLTWPSLGGACGWCRPYCACVPRAGARCDWSRPRSLGESAPPSGRN